MKKILALSILTVLFTSCESKWDTLAGCFTNINQFSQECSDYTVEILKIWDNWENTWDYDEGQMKQDFNKASEEMNWDIVSSLLQKSSKDLEKHYPKEYQSARNDILRLYNIGRELRNVAKRLSPEYIDENDLDDFYDTFSNICERYMSTRESIENDHPEIPGHLYSIYDFIDGTY